MFFIDLYNYNIIDVYSELTITIHIYTYIYILENEEESALQTVTGSSQTEQIFVKDINNNNQCSLHGVPWVFK